MEACAGGDLNGGSREPYAQLVQLSLCIMFCHISSPCYAHHRGGSTWRQALHTSLAGCLHGRLLSTSASNNPAVEHKSTVTHSLSCVDQPAWTSKVQRCSHISRSGAAIPI